MSKDVLLSWGGVVLVETCEVIVEGCIDDGKIVVSRAVDGGKSRVISSRLFEGVNVGDRLVIKWACPRSTRKLDVLGHRGLFISVRNKTQGLRVQLTDNELAPLVVRKGFLPTLAILIGLSVIGGVYLGTTNSFVAGASLTAVSCFFSWLGCRYFFGWPSYETPYLKMQAGCLMPELSESNEKQTQDIAA